MTEKEQMVIQAKRQFVKQQLRWVLQAACPNIANVEYRYCKGINEEIVTVSILGGQQLQVCVTADSLFAIVKDVVKALDERG